jgi:hypothetical protein
MAVASFSLDASARSARDHLSEFSTLVSTLRDGQSLYGPLLVAKVFKVLPQQLAYINTVSFCTAKNFLGDAHGGFPMASV